MRRALIIVSAAAACGLVIPAPVDAGGGCPRERQTYGSGATVELAENCMSPGVLRTEPGTVVTFVNRDSVIHNVAGTRWGSPELRLGASFTNRFDEAGTFPFSCSFHPGMIGAIVVGDGLGSATVSPAAKTQPVLASSATPEGDDRLPLGLAVGAAVGVAATIGVRRLRRLT